MTFKDTFHETYSALAANKIRSGLTMLGIIIGISSVIALLSIGQGAQNSIQSSIQSIGSNLIIISPSAAKGPGVTVSAGRGTAQSLTLADATAIGTQIPEVKAVAPEVDVREQLTAKGQNTNVQVVGTTSAYPGVRNLQVAEGNFLTDQDVSGTTKVAVIGPNVRDDLYGVGAEVIGQLIRIKQTDFTIIGITATKGSSGFGSTDDEVFIPVTTAQRFFSGNKYVSLISASAMDANSTAQAQTDITNLLLGLHNIGDPTLADFTTVNQADIAATASSVAQTFTILLGAVAGISLVVGGIGIMNMMLTTVTERTKEIGLRKAIGAKGKDINTQFLIEAMSLTFLGGTIGIILGCTVAIGVSYFGLIATQISLFSILLSFLVSAAIGIVFGYYPAKRAGGLNPIEALRYE